MPINLIASIAVSVTLLFAGVAMVTVLPENIATEQTTQVATLEWR